MLYAKSTINGKIIELHTFLMNTPIGFEIDHRDRNGLNCTRKNMRIATRSQNQINRGPQKNNTSGYKGVTWDKQSQKWKAQIKINRAKKHLGDFDNPITAAHAYDSAAYELFGDFAYLNFPIDKS